MAKGSSVWIDQLVSLLGLDKETVRTQILPLLDSFDDEASLRTHLQGLVGTDTPLAKSFVRDFTRSRFPQQEASVSGSTTPTLSSAPMPANPSGSGSTAQKKRGKKTLAERAGIGQTLAPRKLEDAGMGEEEQMAKLAEAFGGMGTVYRKKQDDEDFFAGTKGKKAKQTAAKSVLSSEAVETSQPEQTSIADSLPVEASYSAPINEPCSSTSLAKPSPPPTAEMLAIDAVVEELTSATSASTSTSTSINRKLCFCQGRRHPLAPHAPLCYSCGLILCSAIHPWPLSPLSSCPSCSASPLLSPAARSDLVAKLSAEREVLYEQQLLQIQLEREQKKLNKSNARSTREEEAALFPQLGSQPSSSSAAVSTSGYGHTGPVMGKHGALQKAKAIAGDAQRTAKVLSLDMKTHKVKSHTKIVRPKVVTEPKTEVEKVEEVKEEEKDPFVGLDGTALVRNDADDGLRQPSPGALGKGKGVTGVGKAIPKRSWSFAGKELILQAMPAVK